VPTASVFFATPAEAITPRDEARFFGGIKTANDTFKRTEPGRLRSIDAALVARLAAAGATIGEALDLGISSGTTTLELVETLRDAGHPGIVTGTDRLLEAQLVELPLSCRALVEPPGHVLQYEILGAPLRPWRRRLDYVSGMLAVRGLAHLALRRTALERARRTDHSRRVALVTPRLSQASGIHLVEDDVTERRCDFVGRFDLVRAANILNRHYFTPELLLRAVDNVRAYLRGPGAWLLVLRTLGTADHQGTLFRLDDSGRLAVVERYGRGSEIEALLLERHG